MLRALRVLPLLSCVACVSVVACQGGASSAPSEAPKLSAPDLTSLPGEAAANDSLPPGHPPVGDQLPPGHPAVGDSLPADHPSVEGASAGGAPTGAAEAGGLTWEAPAPLVRRAPKSSMRAAEYGVSGDERAELTVFYFGPGASGGVEANVTRWLGQFQQADGKDTASVAKRAKREVAGIAVSTVEAGGRFSGGMGMGGGAAAAGGDGYFLLGAIAEGPEGAVFFKLVGPRVGVESARVAFDKLIASLRPAR